jgi:hypothetical protein
MTDPEQYRASAQTCHNLHRLGKVDSETLALVLVDISYLALEAGRTSDAVYILGGLPEGFPGLLRAAVERAPMTALNVTRLADLLLEKGLITEGFDTTIYGSTATTKGPVS